MTEETPALELPLFARSITFLVRPDDEPTTPTGNVGVLQPFSGLLGNEFKRGGWGPLPLSHIVLSATVRQGLRPATNPATTDPDSAGRNASGGSPTLRVRDLLRERSREPAGQSGPDQESATGFERRTPSMTRTEATSAREPRTSERPGGANEIGLGELADGLDESTSEVDKEMAKQSKHLSKTDEPGSGPSPSAQSDDRPTHGNSVDSDSESLDLGSSPPDLSPPTSDGFKSGRSQGTGPDSRFDLGDATGRLPRLATLDTPMTRHQSATETPTTASRIETSPTLSPVETPPLASDEGGIDFGSLLASRPAHGRADSAPAGAFQMTYHRPHSVASSSIDRSTEPKDAINQSAAESADSGSERTDAERGGPNGTGPPRPAEIDLDGIDVSRLVDRVYDEFQRKTRIERERRGL